MDREILLKLVKRSSKYRTIGQVENDIYMKGLQHGIEEAIGIIKKYEGDNDV